MTEAELLERLRKVERLFAGAATPGERDAAAGALERIRAKLRSTEQAAPPEEFQFSISDPWKRKLFLALLRRYGITPYKLPRQKRQTVMARIPKPFLEETLWPEFQQLGDILADYLSEITDTVIRSEIHGDVSEAEERPSTNRLT